MSSTTNDINRPYMLCIYSCLIAISALICTFTSNIISQIQTMKQARPMAAASPLASYFISCPPDLGYYLTISQADHIHPRDRPKRGLGCSCAVRPFLSRTLIRFVYIRMRPLCRGAVTGSIQLQLTPFRDLLATPIGWSRKSKSLNGRQLRPHLHPHVHQTSMFQGESVKPSLAPSFGFRNQRHHLAF